MTDMNIITMLSANFGALPKYPQHLARPTKAVVREVDIGVSGSKISLGFSRGTNHPSLDDASFKELLKSLAAGTFDQNASFSAASKPPDRSPLSANNQGLTYVIYVLSAKNWEFTAGHPPITLDKESLGKSAYFEARSVNASGDIELSGGKVAYLIADANAAQHGEPDYEDRINLHVDIVIGTQRIPIIIDPDIRNPGGSEP